MRKAIALALLFTLAGCSLRQQQTPIVAPPQIVEVVKVVAVPCPIPPEIPEPQLLLPLLDEQTATVQSILQVIRADYATLWLAYTQAVEILRVYMQQAEVRNAEEAGP